MLNLILFLERRREKTFILKWVTEKYAGHVLQTTIETLKKLIPLNIFMKMSSNQS